MGLSTGGAYLVRRNGRYAFRIRLPSRLARRIGRTEILRSLSTSDPRMARLLAASLGLRVDRLWSRIGGMSEAKNEVERLLEVWFRKELDRAWRQFHAGEAGDGGDEPDNLDPDQRRARRRDLAGSFSEMRLEQLQADYQRGDYAAGRPVARKVLADLDAPIDEADHRFTLVAAAAVQAEAAIHDATFRWSSGELTYRPCWRAGLDEGAFPIPVAPATVRSAVGAVAPMPAPALPVAAPAPVAVPPAPAPLPSGQTMSEAISAYMADTKRRTRITDTEAGQKERRVREFVRAFGDVEVASVTRRDAGRWFEALSHLPSRYVDHPDLKGLGFFQASQKAKQIALAVCRVGVPIWLCCVQTARHVELHPVQP